MHNKKIKILAITYHPWRDDISLGNTFSNIFSGMDDRLEFANIYIRDDKPNNRLVSRYFHISENKMMHSIITRKPVGEEVFPKNEGVLESFSKGYNTARRLRWDSLLLAQDLLSVSYHWKSKELDEFIRDYNPDLIFGVLGRIPIANRIMTYASEKYSIPLIAYAWDDHYSLQKQSLSPFFWLKTFVERRYIRKCALQSSYLYTITSLMKKEYTTYFGKECKLLYKGFEFGSNPKIKESGNAIKIVYMGNIGAERWKVLANFAIVLDNLNKNNINFSLDIYTLSPASQEMRNALNTKYCHLKDPVPTSQKAKTLADADILLHVEPVSKKELLLFRLSFSTKIVDYLFSGKCILAVGENTGSINYLKENDAAIVLNDCSMIDSCLRNIYTNKNLIKEYGEKAWVCGKMNHQLSGIQNQLYQDIKEIVSK